MVVNVESKSLGRASESQVYPPYLNTGNKNTEGKREGHPGMPFPATSTFLCPRPTREAQADPFPVYF